MEYQVQYQKYLEKVSSSLKEACDRFLPEESEVCRQHYLKHFPQNRYS